MNNLSIRYFLVQYDTWLGLQSEVLGLVYVKICIHCKSLNLEPQMGSLYMIVFTVTKEKIGEKFQWHIFLIFRKPHILGISGMIAGNSFFQSYPALFLADYTVTIGIRHAEMTFRYSICARKDFEASFEDRSIGI